MTKDMTVGSPVKLIMQFSVPIFMGSLFLQIQSFSDTLIVSNYLGLGELSAIGSINPLIYMFTGALNGLIGGFAPSISKYFGAKDTYSIKRIILHTAVIIISVSALICAGAIIFSRNILFLMNIPADIFELTHDYMCVNLFCSMLTMIFNISYYFINATGDAITSLLYLISKTFAGIILDILFIIIFDLGIIGVAIASALSNIIVSIIFLFYVKRKYTFIKFSPSDIKLDFGTIKELLGLGIPLAIYSLFLSCGSTILQSSVNSLGDIAISAKTIGEQIERLMVIPLSSMGSALAVFTAQNYGAKRMNRIKKGLFDAAKIQIGICALITIILIFFRDNLILLFSKNLPNITNMYANQYLLVFAIFSLMIGAVHFYLPLSKALGNSKPNIAAGILEFFARLLVSLILVKTIGFSAVNISNPIAWSGSLLAFVLPFHLRYRKLHKEYQQNM